MRRTLLVAAIAILPLSLRAQTQVIDFENVSSENLTQFHSLVGYAGFDWSYSGGWNSWTVVSSRPASGTHNATAPGEASVIWFARPGEPFTLNSIFLSINNYGRPTTEAEIWVTGALNGVQVFNTMVSASTTSMEQFVFDSTPVDKVSFFARNGNLLVDDISVTATPEPSTFLLLGSGLAGLARVRRRRRVA